MTTDDVIAASVAIIRADIDELRTLRSVDVVDLHSVSAGLRAAVLRDGRVIYQLTQLQQQPE